MIIKTVVSFIVCFYLLKNCLTINKYGVLDEHKTFKCFTKTSNILDRKEYFIMLDGGNLVAKVPLSWEKSFSYGVIIPQKLKNWIVLKKKIVCVIIVTI